MTTREDLYKRFGPKLIDAIVQLIVEQFNVLRSEVGLSQITEQQVLDGIANKLENIPDYTWMNKYLL